MPSRSRMSAADRDHLDVGARLGRAQHLEVDLVELALAALLRPLVAEHRAGGEELERQLLRQLAVGDEGAADAGGVFRPQRERFAAAIGEGVHLLGDDVGGLADAAREQLGELEDRRRHLAIAVEARHVARRVDDVREAPVLVGQEDRACRARAAACSREIALKEIVEEGIGRRYSAAARCRSAFRRLRGLDLGRLLLDQLDQMVDDVWRPSADDAARRRYRPGACRCRRR